jgi:hypothetical protein
MLFRFDQHVRRGFVALIHAVLACTQVMKKYCNCGLQTHLYIPVFVVPDCSLIITLKVGVQDES